jgi:hypothetical protein
LTIIPTASRQADLPEAALIGIDTVLPVKRWIWFFLDLAQRASVLSAVKDKARYRARASGPP